MSELATTKKAPIVGFSAGGSVASQAFAKATSRLGIIPIAHDCSERIIANRELGIKMISPQLSDESSYLRFLVGFIEQSDHYIPFLDEELLFCSQLIEAGLVPAHKLLLSSSETIRLCNDKLLFRNTMHDLQIPVPANPSTAPAFVKPRYGSGGKQSLIIRSNTSLHLIQQIAEAEHLIVEEYISGSVVSADLLWDEDNNLLSSSFRYRSVGSGVSTHSLSVSDSSLLRVLLSIILSLAEHVKFRGLTSFQFLIGDDHPKLLEVNPRAGGSIVHSHMLGSDILLTYFNYCLGLSLELHDREDGLSPRVTQIVRFYEDCPS